MGRPPEGYEVNNKNSADKAEINLSGKQKEMPLLIVVKESKGQKEINIPLNKTSDILNWLRNISVFHSILRMTIFSN